MEWALSPIEKWLATPITLAPLLHQWAHLSWQIIIVACRAPSRIRLMITLFSSSTHSTLTSRDGPSSWRPEKFPLICSMTRRLFKIYCCLSKYVCVLWAYSCWWRLVSLHCGIIRYRVLLLFSDLLSILENDSCVAGKEECSDSRTLPWAAVWT